MWPSQIAGAKMLVILGLCALFSFSWLVFGDMLIELGAYADSAA